MSSITALTLTLGLLMTIFGGKQGFSSFISVILNFIILFITVVFISSGLPPLIVSAFSGICILAITIYMGNNDEQSTNVAFISTLIVLGVMLILIIPLDHFAQIKGFAMEESEEIEAFNLLIGISFEKLLISTTILSTLGAIAEAATAIASGLEEIIEQHPNITRKGLFESGRNIGSQIMGMTFNTLFFGMFGSDLALFVLLTKLHSSASYYINSKIFVSECMSVLYSAIAIIGVIVITTYFMARKVEKNKIKSDVLGEKNK